MVSELLKKAFAEAAKVAPSEQEALAAWILAELASERRWQDAFERSQEKLARLADEALDECRSGETQDLDADSL